MPRIVPTGLTARVEAAAWPVPSLFRLIAERGEVPATEMYRVFNMGLGMLVFLPPECDAASLPGLDAVPVGDVRSGGSRRFELIL